MSNHDLILAIAALLAAVWFGFQIGAMWGTWTGRREAGR